MLFQPHIDASILLVKHTPLVIFILIAFFDDIADCISNISRYLLFLDAIDYSIVFETWM